MAFIDMIMTFDCNIATPIHEGIAMQANASSLHGRRSWTSAAADEYLQILT